MVLICFSSKKNLWPRQIHPKKFHPTKNNKALYVRNKATYFKTNDKLIREFHEFWKTNPNPFFYETDSFDHNDMKSWIKESKTNLRKKKRKKDQSICDFEIKKNMPKFVKINRKLK